MEKAIDGWHLPPILECDEDIESERRTSRSGNKRLRSFPDSVIFRQKEPELMTKMAVPSACSSSNKCVARHIKPDPHKDSSSYSASSLFGRRRRRRGVTTQLDKNSSSYERERGKGDNHTTRV
jgi:hypothetical protein